MTNKEESTKNDLALGTTNNIQLIGDRIVIRLDEAVDHTVRNGIIIPVNTEVDSETGKIKTQLSRVRHLAKGTVLNISEHSKEKLLNLGVTLNVNDRVYVSHQVVNSASYQWKNERDQLISEFDGVVCIPHGLVEAKIN